MSGYDTFNMALAQVLVEEHGWKIVSTHNHEKHGTFVFDVGIPNRTYKYTNSGYLRCCTKGINYHTGKPKITNSIIKGRVGNKLTFNDAMRYLVKRFGKKGKVE